MSSAERDEIALEDKDSSLHHLKLPTCFFSIYAMFYIDGCVVVSVNNAFVGQKHGKQTLVRRKKVIRILLAFHAGLQTLEWDSLNSYEVPKYLRSAYLC